jgi:mannose-6-phosphate isomerase-like protein (cupin superfamily)
MDPHIRRVVTSHDDTGKAVVLFDSATPHRSERAGTGIVSQLMWVTDATPEDLTSANDKAARTIGIPPPAGGSVFRVVDFPPGTDKLALPADHLARQMGGGHAAGAARPPRHHAMHRTRSIDYAIVLSGEIDMLLDDSEIHLKAGDVLVQQATNHAWVNRGSTPCRIAFILIDAQDPLGAPA